MFEYFNEQAIKSVVLSQEEARNTGHNLVGTEHLLLGVIGEGTSAAAKNLTTKNITVDSTRALATETVGKGSGYVPANIPFTPKAKNTLEHAFQEARQLKDNYIGPEHILLAITRQKDTLAAKLLTQQGIDLRQLRTEIIKELGEREPVTAAAPKRSSFGMPRQQQSVALKEFSTNLTELAKAGKLDPVVGRSAEIERVVQILGRRTKNNPVMVGEPGVGKTAIAEGLAQRIVDGDVTQLLEGKEVISLDMGLLLAGTKFRGEFEERLKSIVDEVRSAGNIILVIDEIHTLVGAGAMGGAMDAANMLKPALARGEIQCLGSTTLDEYRQHIERDAALERRFQKVTIGEPSPEDAIEILRGLRKTYEEYHQVKFTDKAIEVAVTLSERYISDRFLPDKAIDLIDEAGSRTHLEHSLHSNNNSEDTAEVATIDPQALTPVVDEESIAKIVAAWTGIPVTKMTETESETLLHLEDNLHERVIGQDEAVRAVSRALRRSRSGLGDRNRPIASLFFSGPTGVGKTELAKALAVQMFGSEEAIVRIDMSELMEAHTVSKLIGSPPGYVGYDEGGQLTEAIRRQPYTVVLFDEIEKAHPDVFNLLLQLLDDGRLTDAQGRVVNFKNTVIIMTSNVGSKVIEKGGSGLGFNFAEDESEAQYNRIKELVNQELKQYFRPEFINRLDEIIVFRQLTKPEVKEISEILLQEVSQRLEEQREITLEVTEAFKDKVVDEGFDPSYGARPLRRAIVRLLEDSLAEAILSGRVDDGDTALVDVDDEEVTILPIAQPALVEAVN
ncbi:ATP-dependent Clp protease ATP-binding subunit [Myxosarcina sp. GI1]|uniref:ATP-dependent Clp protease ATP-binding subunit n=1 Tax=Myxosarcina sp. GI1 TaxID=1541065 RepID=UPI0005620F05|nr:ATP-dependent Clp protease ATP-binding subunit [Myxosarcina sp. GI1]